MSECPRAAVAVYSLCSELVRFHVVAKSNVVLYKSLDVRACERNVDDNSKYTRKLLYCYLLIYLLRHLALFACIYRLIAVLYAVLALRQ